MAQNNKLAPALTKRLKNTFAANEIKGFASILGELEARGLKIDDVFPHGIPANVDALQVRGSLPPGDLAKLGDIVSGAGNVREVKVFPRGIVIQDSLRVHLVLPRG